MFGILENGERLPSKEEKAAFIDKMFDISMAAPEMLVAYDPISVEDFEMCIEILQTLKNGAERIINEKLGKNKV